MQWNRRDLIGTAVKTAAAAPLILPQSARGANDRPTYVLIGAGGRGRNLSRAFQKLGAVPLGLCDVYEPHLQIAVKESPQGTKTFVDYHEMLAQLGNIDFVVSGTPDHHHQPTLAAALAAKKDIYLEKPLSMTIEQSHEMVKMVRATDRIVQIGM
ncbi:MAG: Gfo/Idh/MocA family oxidoreductase, partial [Bryobacterales bacterium]|nr:Gfo/Idh/MocA family oxidoreductase [Bryobacterales bacterium]